MEGSWVGLGPYGLQVYYPVLNSPLHPVGRTSAARRSGKRRCARAIKLPIQITPLLHRLDCGYMLTRVDGDSFLTPVVFFLSFLCGAERKAWAKHSGQETPPVCV